LSDLLSKGAVGSINLRYFNAAGVVVPSELHERVIGLTLDEMRKIPRVIGVAGGASKRKAIRAALDARLIRGLVTDQVTAAHMLAAE
jgi:DNA-binding transcriptional regulator LsrR (DeoR family)